MKKVLQKKIIPIIGFCILILLFGCKDTNITSDTSQIVENLFEKKNNTKNISEENDTVSTDNTIFNHIGDTVPYEKSFSEDSDEIINITIENITLFNTLEESNISADKFVDEEFATQNYNKDNFKLLVADIKITNESYEFTEQDPDLGISIISLMTKEQISNPKIIVPSIMEIEYFSDAPNRELYPTAYYHFFLDIGSSKNIQVGWIIDTSDPGLDTNIDLRKQLVIRVGLNTQDDKYYVDIGE